MQLINTWRNDQDAAPALRARLVGTGALVTVVSRTQRAGPGALMSRPCRYSLETG
jgi:hypothetical protein